MGHSIDGKDSAIAYAEKAGTGADKDRSVAVFDEAGDQFGLEQVSFLTRIDLAGRKEKEPRIGANPETSFSVRKDRTNSVTWGFDAQQIVMEGVAIVAVDTIEPCTYPDVSASVFGECADWSGN